MKVIHMYLSRRVRDKNFSYQHVQRSLLYAYNRANIGPSKTYHLLEEQLGGCQHVGCTQRFTK